MANEIDVTVPPVGESVSEGAIGRWFFKDGDLVKKDQPLFELDSDKASMEVPASETGRLKILAQAGETVAVGATVAKIDTAAESTATGSGSNGKASSPKAASGKAKKAEPMSSGSETQAKDSEASMTKTQSAEPQRPKQEAPRLDDSKIKKFSPSQRRAIRHGEIQPEKLSPSLSSGILDTARREKMSPIRKTVAKRLLQSQQSTATLTTFNEVDMSSLLALRSKLKDDFQKKFGIKLGFMSFFTAAVVAALREFPTVNSHIDGDEIVHPDGYHIGIAVSSERGLVVPVLKHCESLSYAEIEQGIADLAEKARQGKVSISDMQGGSFTITNGGVFGSLLSTPILNPPQSGILGMHKTEHRPVAVQKESGEFEVTVRPMMYLALSYDHRLIDGSTSVGFLVKIKDYLETVSEEKVLAPQV
ncbi:MAG: 2-oxoglutarate dehydrogenase complex dihydrolipoyllysine-residue succinyltransferase [Bradymonadales bacterium]|nr:MAG: 2-oxoglutarate dehydrogenase complex dihydrolipoyllysine-residue succinyltransferase [Bradymonadales bacterium]